MPNGLPDPSMPVPGQIEVVESIGQPTSYRLRYGFGIESGDLPLLTEDMLGPESNLAVVISGELLPNILVSGPVVRQEISLAQGGEGSTLDVIGMDKMVEMDREDKARIWSNQLDSAVVMAILAEYGVVPDVEVTTTLHVELKHALVQRETDLRFIQRLARRNGFWFWLSEEAPGVTIGHFKKPPVNDSASVDLRINVSDPNVDSVAIAWDVERPVSTSLSQLDLNSKNVIDGSVQQSSLVGLASNNLGSIINSTHQAHIAVPVDDAGDLSSRGEALLMDNGWFVHARLTVRKSRLHDIVRAHSVVTLTGAGSRHSGSYIVSRVQHTINPDDHTMAVELIRNAWN
jgi:hypothetical protein